MKILWLCNIMLPMIAEHFGLESSNKEGWLSGLASVVLQRKQENGIELVIAFPAPSGLLKKAEGDILHARIDHCGYGFEAYGFWEDVSKPEKYSPELERQLADIIDDCCPDIVHCFGTEYPHTLAMCRVFPDKSRILVGIQGLCSVYANAYFANLPGKVIHRVTFRDWLKRDSLIRQQRKFAVRGKMEQEAIRLAGNITGRTDWDKHYAREWNPDADYHFMNETLRPQFYEGAWQEDACIPHSIFLSQGDYPIKGLHYMLLALPEIRKAYPDVHVYVAGNSLVEYKSLKDKIKISAYGKYLRNLMKKGDLWNNVTFLGRLSAEEMKERYLKSHLFVCCSAIENSPNSLGEAMLLGMPCVSADVGGIASIFEKEKDGILYSGYKTVKNTFDNTCDLNSKAETTLEENVKHLVSAVLEVWSNKEQLQEYCQNARKHARKTHDKEANYHEMTEIYAKILERNMPRFVFVSNYINHHQIPFCNEMHRILQGSFVFIQTEPMEEERVRMGWQAENTAPYVHYFYEEPDLCRKWIDNCEVVLFGGTDDESYIVNRLQKHKPVIRYSERLYKQGQWKAVSPRGLLKKYKDHTRYRKENVYMLCSGAYVPSDFHIVGAYPEKLLRWGYFPETQKYDLESLMAEKVAGNILWAARMIDWKHPELPVETAKRLRDKGCRFHMDIVGGGAMEEQIKQLVAEYQLEDWVTLQGYRTPAEVRRLMERADIYLVTSDRQEGWGAVVNEAMNSGCAVVANHMIGAVPFLVKPGRNGLVYRDGDDEMLFAQVEALLSDREKCHLLGKNAMETICEEWNAENAAVRLVQFCLRQKFLPETVVCLETEEDWRQIPQSGPCSPAPVIAERRMYEEMNHE